MKHSPALLPFGNGRPSQSLYYPPLTSIDRCRRPDTDPVWSALADATFRAYREAVIRLPPDVLRVIEKAAAAETNPVARGEFANILKNIKAAEKLGVPICQDTGIPVVYLTLPPDVPVSRGTVSMR